MQRDTCFDIERIFMGSTGNRRKFVAFLVVMTAAGCAGVTVNKVPTPTQYVHWTDDMQEDADEMEGFRFYLPRPFLNVFEPFPVRTDIYIADGVVSPDGQYVIIKQIKGESELSQHIAGIGVDARIPRRAIRAPNLDGALKAQSAFEDAASKGARNAGTFATTGSVGAMSVPGRTGPTQPATGVNSRKVGNDNGAFAYQPLRGSFDIAFVPDFEEQYVISSDAGLGNAEFQLNLGQGWSLQSFNSLTDNSALNERIFDLIDTSVQTAKAAASAFAGGLPLAAQSALEVGTSLLRPQSGEEMESGGQPGTDVSVKIVVVHYAAKGFYPVIKPRELQERLASKVTDYLFFDLFELFPLTNYASDYDPKAILRAQEAIQNETGKFTVPRYPYQFVSFNTFRYMAIEVVQPNVDPFRVLYPSTGTRNDAPPAPPIPVAPGSPPTSNGRTDADRLSQIVAEFTSGSFDFSESFHGLMLKATKAALVTGGISVSIERVSGFVDTANHKIADLQSWVERAIRNAYMKSLGFDGSFVVQLSDPDAYLNQLLEPRPGDLKDLAAWLGTKPLKIEIQGLNLETGPAVESSGKMQLRLKRSDTSTITADATWDALTTELYAKLKSAAEKDATLRIPKIEVVLATKDAIDVANRDEIEKLLKKAGS